MSFQADAADGADKMAFWEKFFAGWHDAVGDSETGREGIAELHAIMRLCAAAGYGHDVIRADPSVVRGLEYYTGPVYEAELTFPVTNEDGQTVRFGSVAGGGRYDGLVGRFRAEPVPATGFSIGVSRLFSALQLVGSPLLAGAEAPGPVVVLVLDRENMADYQRLVALPARRRHPGRALSRRRRHEGADEIRRPPPRPGGDHPGLERARWPARSRSRT